MESTNMASRQKVFMSKADQTTTEFNSNQSLLYKRLIEEETAEFFEAIYNNEPVEEHLKEAADILVVTLGYIISHGVDPEELMKLVQYNNLQKVLNTPVKDSHGKVMKSPESISAKANMLLSIAELVRATTLHGDI